MSVGAGRGGASEERHHPRLSREMGSGSAGRCPLPFVPLLLVVLVVLLALLGATATGAVAGCPGCARPKPADSIRLEAIKLQILTKLGLPSKPQIKRTLSKEVVLASLSKAGELPFYQEPHYSSSSSSYSHMASSSSSFSSSSGVSQDDGYSDYDDFYGRTSEIITFAEQEADSENSKLSYQEFGKVDHSILIHVDIS